MKKKIVIIVSVILIGLVLLIPIPQRLKDGGSVEYRALLYKITDVHRLNSLEADKPYLEGIIVELFGIEVYNNVD